MSETLLRWFTPWQPLYGLIALFALVAACYIRGLARRRRARDIAPACAFLTGLALMYVFTQTYADYYSRYMFFIHRIQHLALHHVAPFLIAIAAPTPVLAAGAPRWLARGTGSIAAWPPLRGLYRVIQQPVVSALLFVGLIAFWLTPAVHFYAMLDTTDYWLMNLGMALDGVLFWWFMLDRRPPGRTATTYSIGVRIVVLWAVMPPQIAIGAYIALSNHVIYTAYATCGRAFPISPILDQQLGGLITWIPAAMMSVLATLVLLRIGFAHERARDAAPAVGAAVR